MKGVMAGPGTPPMVDFFDDDNAEDLSYSDLDIFPGKIHGVSVFRPRGSSIMTLWNRVCMVIVVVVSLTCHCTLPVTNPLEFLPLPPP